MSDTRAEAGTVDDEIELDGRRQRRDRNRDAVVDAMLDLHREGNLSPSVAELAERSGVSHRSVFRYFDDLDDLFRVALSRSAERFSPLLKIHRYGEGELPERVENLVGQRIDFYEVAAPSLRAQRLKAPFNHLLAHDLENTRALLRDQLRVQFRYELDRMSDTEATAALAAGDVLTSLESYDLMRLDQRMSRAKVAGAWRSALHRVLTR